MWSATPLSPYFPPQSQSFQTAQKPSTPKKPIPPQTSQNKRKSASVHNLPTDKTVYISTPYPQGISPNPTILFARLRHKAQSVFTASEILGTMGRSQRPRRPLGTKARIIDAGLGVTGSRMQVGSCGLERVVARGCIGWNGTDPRGSQEPRRQKGCNRDDAGKWGSNAALSAAGGDVCSASWACCNPLGGS